MSDTPAPPSNQVTAGSSGAPDKPKPAEENAAEKKAASPADILDNVNISSLPQEQIAALESGDPEQMATVLASLEGDGKPAPEAPEEKDAKPEEPAPKEAEKPEDDEKPQQEEPTPPEAKHKEEGTPKRMSFKALKEDDQVLVANAIISVREGKHETFDEAYRALKGDPEPAPAAKPDAAKVDDKKADEAPAEAKPDEEVESENLEAPKIQQQIDKLRSDRKAALKEYDYDKANELEAEIDDLQPKLIEAAISDREAASSIQRLQAEENASRDRATLKYADLMADPDSSFNDYLNAEIIVAENKGDDILNQTDWPEKIADRVAQKFFGGKTASEASTKSQSEKIAAEASNVPAPPKTGVRMPGAPVPDSAESAPLTASQAAAEFDSLTPEQKEQVLAAADKSLSGA